MLLFASVARAILLPVSQWTEYVVERWRKLLCAVFESSLEDGAFLCDEARMLNSVRRVYNTVS